MPLEPQLVGAKPTSVNARFFKDGNKTMVAVQYAGDASQEAVAKITPKLIQQFPREWDAFINGLNLPEPDGTPLTEIPGFTQDIARIYKMRGIMVCEQLAEASDSVCQGLGMGAVNFRKMAKIIADSKRMEQTMAKAASEAVTKVQAEAKPSKAPRKEA